MGFNLLDMASLADRPADWRRGEDGRFVTEAAGRWASKWMVLLVKWGSHIATQTGSISISPVTRVGCLLVRALATSVPYECPITLTFAIPLLSK